VTPLVTAIVRYPDDIVILFTAAPHARHVGAAHAQ
jgi:hypothetical protein